MTQPIATNKSQSTTFQLRSGNAATFADDLSIPSERCTLRPISLDYAEVIFSEFSPEVTRYMTPRPAKEISETAEFIKSAISQRQAATDLILVILDRESNQFLGVCGLHVRGNNSEPEFGIWLRKSAHGSGYGKEAITTLKDWAEETLALDSFIYPVDRNNTPSRKIPESLDGIVFEEKQVKTMGGQILDEVVYRIPAKSAF